LCHSVRSGRSRQSAFGGSAPRAGSRAAGGVRAQAVRRRGRGHDGDREWLNEWGGSYG
jgi:hypothetical protein